MSSRHDPIDYACNLPLNLKPIPSLTISLPPDKPQLAAVDKLYPTDVLEFLYSSTDLHDTLGLTVSNKSYIYIYGLIVLELRLLSHRQNGDCLMYFVINVCICKRKSNRRWSQKFLLFYGLTFVHYDPNIMLDFDSWQFSIALPSYANIHIGRNNNLTIDNILNY